MEKVFQNRNGSTRVKNVRVVMCLPAHDVTVIIFATFKMRYEHFHSKKLQYSAYLSKILCYKMYLFLVPMYFKSHYINPCLHTVIHVNGVAIDPRQSFFFCIFNAFKYRYFLFSLKSIVSKLK